MIQIGRTYIAYLSEIRHAFIKILGGACQENTEVKMRNVDCHDHCSCCYDRCGQKSRRNAERQITIRHVNREGKTRRLSLNYFHEQCLDDILRDRRLPDLN